MTQKFDEFKGVITALVTPFQDGELDLRSFRRLLRFQLDQGVQGFVVNGTTGESPTLRPEEVETLCEAAKAEVAGQVPLIVGTGSNSTAKTIEFTRRAVSWGADAVLVVVPYYNKPPQRGLVRHFTEVAQHSERPVLLYNVPARTAVNLLPAAVAELSHVPRIAGVKDATGDSDVAEQLVQTVRPGFTLLSGDDATCVEFCRRGGEGVISVCSHIIAPEMKEAVLKARQSDRAAVKAYHERFAGFLKLLYVEANPIPVKMALHWMGILDSPELRLPLVELDQRFHKEFQACLRNLGKL
ncbi:MAG: 4-hydroxy-tetrahydrodipicolinate synthase [Bdellovibrionales bacterium]